MAKTTTFLIDGADYFAARLDNGGIRVGLKNVKCMDIPVGHRLFLEANAIRTETAAEFFFDNHVATA